MFVFVEVETDEGLKGFGITGSFLPWAIIACIENHLAPALKGRDVLHTEDIHSHVWKKLNSRAYTGVVSNALSAIDIALWDIRGKKERRSIHELLGGYRNWAPTYATFGYPFVFGIVTFGVYSINYSMADVTIALVAGAVGFIMLKLEYAPVPLVLGLVLGPLLERGVRRTLILSEGDLFVFIDRPIALTFLLLTVAVVVVPLIVKRYRPVPPAI